MERAEKREREQQGDEKIYVSSFSRDKGKSIYAHIHTHTHASFSRVMESKAKWKNRVVCTFVKKKEREEKKASNPIHV